MFAPPGRHDTWRRGPKLPVPDLNIESERALKWYVYFVDRSQATQQLSILRSGAGGAAGLLDSQSGQSGANMFPSTVSFRILQNP